MEKDKAKCEDCGALYNPYKEFECIECGHQFLIENKDNKDVIIKALVRDIVELSLSARKVVETGSFYMKDMQEVIILDSMALEILKRHTVEASNEKK